MTKQDKRHSSLQRAIALTGEAERLTAIEILGEGKTEAKIGELVHNAASYAAGITQHLHSKDKAPVRLACQPGCTWCCFQLVTATPAEVLVIAAELQSWPADQCAAMKNRIADLDRITRGQNEDQRFALQRPCPLLQEGLCAVYPVRPLLCRGYNSTDARQCKAAAEHPEIVMTVPADSILLYTHQRIYGGLARGISEAGLPAADLELTAALRIALEDLDPLERWLAGEDVFAAAAISAPPQPSERRRITAQQENDFFTKGAA